MKLLRELLKEAWVSDIQGVRSGQAKAAEQDWVSKAAGREQAGWAIEVRKGTNYIKLDKTYASEEEAKKAIRMLKLSNARPISLYGK